MRLPLNSPPKPSSVHGQPGSGTFGRHMGLDYPVGSGTPVYAPAAGIVTEVAYGTSGGYRLELRIGAYLHRFLHLKSRPKFAVGNTVKSGQLIAYSGNTGQTTGPHLHWDVRKVGTAWNSSASNYINPLTLIEGIDMYKGKSAKYWHDQYQLYYSYTRRWRLRYEGLYARAKAALGKYLGK